MTNMGDLSKDLSLTHSAIWSYALKVRNDPEWKGDRDQINMQCLRSLLCLIGVMNELTLLSTKTYFGNSSEYLATQDVCDASSHKFRIIKGIRLMNQSLPNELKNLQLDVVDFLL